MSAPTLPVDLQWVAHTLMPYLRYAFQHVLHRNLDITPYIQRVLDSSTSKSGSYTDGDDLVFERVFFAIERRHQDLPTELNDFTENLDCLALFLIRRAQEKGPYRLLGRDIPPSDAWKKYESERIAQVAAKNVKVPTYSVPTDTGPPAPPAPNMARVPLLTHNCIDPRLLYAYPGQFTSPELSGTLTLTDLQYYLHRNEEIEASVAMELAHLLNHQQRHGMQRSVSDSQTIPQVYQQNRMSSLRQGHRNGASDQPRSFHVPNPVSQQPHTPSYVRHLGKQQIAIPNQHSSHALNSTPQMYKLAEPTQRLFQQTGYLQPSGYSSRPGVQNIQPRPAPVTSRPLPAQPGSFSNYHGDIHPGFPTLTKPAGISKSVTKAPTFSGLPDFSAPSCRATSMAAFRKLSREQKVAKFLEIDRAEKALNPKAITQVQKVFMKAAAERVAATKINAVGEDRMKQHKENEERIVKLPDQQTIMVPAPSHQTNWDTYMTTPGVGSFGSHPAYSNIMSSFPSPQLHGPLLAPTPTSKREE
ncbi:hypothetical protein AA0119_g10943 [Alternaria tenuissima]|uniref:Uncharacterized protein n=1 Tax=Alternaria tenuissima TaxID=119927 RepID=A0ABY0FXI1_9PLEO|nr:hypothetical protein AA0119_g10943 [Alternaria tenuissima]